MFDLIKNNLIQFDKLMIDQYYKLDVDEVDAIILLRLNDLAQRNIFVLNEVKLAKTMKVDKNKLGERIVKLVTRGFISLELGKDNKEVFNLDNTYQRLANLLGNIKDDEEEKILKRKIKKTITLLEKELKKILSPLELEIVQRWFIEDKYTDDEIDDAILQTLKYKNRGINYMNKLLQTRRRDSELAKDKAENIGNIQELFNKYYARGK